jgi:hypothetical protein
LRVYCAWCGAFKGEKEPLENKTETHGICQKCYRREVRDMLAGKCPKFDDCPKIKIILDKDLADDQQYADAMISVCEKCQGPEI